MKRCQTCNIIGGDNQTVCYADGQPLIDDPLATTLQEAIGEKYSLTQLIGKGAMGAVYRAHHRDLGDVAIKVMLGREGDNQTLSERFLREARALRRLRHQNAVFIYDLDRSPKGVTYMVMEMVAGRSLGQDVRERKRFTLDETLEIAAAVCSALSAAHERGIIHRDLKPDNILRAEEKGVDGQTIRTVKIADFGIVKQRGGDDDESLKLTRTGRPIGTPFYMSPEQWFGDGPGITALDHRTDIYALGCTLYELLAGRPPFLGRTTEEMRHQHLHIEPPPLHTLAPQVPVAVSRVIMRALAKDRDERQQTAADFLEELHSAYGQSFEHTNQKIDELLRTTQESLLSDSGAQERAHDLIDTEESVPLFTETVVALNSLPAPTEGVDVPGLEPQPHAVASEADTLIQPPPADAFINEHASSFPFEHDVQALADNSTAASMAANTTASVAVHKHSRRRLLLIAATVLLLLGSITAVAVAVYLHRTRQTPVTSEKVPYTTPHFKTPEIPMSALVGTLRVRAAPGSEVFIDDELAGNVGPDSLFNARVPVGLRNVRVVAKGARPWARDARVRANQQAQLTAARERPIEVKEGTADERRERALAAADKKDYDTAEAEYRALLKSGPDEREAHILLARVLMQQQRYAEAVAEYETVAELDPKDAETRATLVRLYLMKERDAEAEATARQLLKLAPRDPEAHHLLARVLLRNADKLDEAGREIEAALQSKQAPEFLETKAYLLVAQNSLDEALKAAERAVELDRNKGSFARAAVAVVLYRMERVADAVARYRELRQADKSDRWGDIKWLQRQRGYSKPLMETLEALVARTN